MKKTGWILVAALIIAAALPWHAVVSADAKAPAAEPAFIIDSHPALRPEAREVVGMYRYGHSVAPGVPIPDGYVDGGRGMGIHSSGRVTSGREILIVDRTRDKRLGDSLKFARSAAVTALKPQDRALRLQKHIQWVMGHRRDRKTPLRNVDQLQGRYRGKGVLIGDVGALCNDGVCRHMSLLFKVLADEAGLNVAMVRGNYRHSNGRIGGHAWNELHLDNGVVFIFDVLNSRHFYGLKYAKAAKYLNMSKRPMYPGGLVPRRAPWITTVETAAATGKATLKIATPSMYGQVHYTLDGSGPAKDSPRYTQPVPLSKTTTVKAVAIYGNGDASKIVTKQIRVLDWKTPVTGRDLKPGLRYRYYTGRTFKALPAFEELKPESTGRLDTFDISRGKGKDNFAMLFTGYIKVPAKGVYVFSTNSDDGSKLWIGDQCVVDNGGRHAPQVRSGAVALKAGLHPLRVGYFEYIGDETLSVTVGGPDAKEQPVPKTMLFSPK